MKFAKKYVLLDQDNYHRLSESNETKLLQTKNIFQHPDVSIALKEQKRMEQIANNDELLDSEKLQQHSQALKKYLESFRDVIKLSKSQAILGDDRKKETMALSDTPQSETPTFLKLEKEDDGDGSQPKSLTTSETSPSSPTAVKRPPSTNLTVAQIVGGLPNHTRSKARKLLGDVKKIPNLIWTNDGEVIYRGKLTKGSDIKQLIGDAVGATSRKSSKLSIRRKFNNILDENGIHHKQVGYGRSDYSHFKKMTDSVKWVCHG